MAWIVDLDGVVWLGEDPIPGAAGAISRLRAAGERLCFLTNNSSMTPSDYVAKLAAHGIPISRDEVITSAQAVATLVEPGLTALVAGGRGVVEALEERGVRVVREGMADVVVVGWHRDFDFDRMAVASSAVRAGAHLLATNEDATFPAPDGLLPGCGAILASIVTASGAVPEIAGKPHRPMAALVEQVLGRDEIEHSRMVGDRPNTDGVMAKSLGIPFWLVLTGVTSAADLPTDPPADVVGADLAALVDQYAGRG